MSSCWAGLLLSVVAPARMSDSRQGTSQQVPNPATEHVFCLRDLVGRRSQRDKVKTGKKLYRGWVNGQTSDRSQCLSRASDWVQASCKKTSCEGVHRECQAPNASMACRRAAVLSQSMARCMEGCMVEGEARWLAQRAVLDP